MICRTRNCQKNNNPFGSMHFRFSYSLVIVLSLITACENENTSSYFPLNRGPQWNYQIVIETPSGKQFRSYNVRNIGRKTVDKKSYAVRHTSYGTDYYFSEDSDGIFRVGKRTSVEIKPRMDTPMRPVLEYPLEKGMKWQASTHPYVLKRLMPVGEALKNSFTLPMLYTVVSTNEAITVPAGEYKHCVKVVGSADLVLYVNPLRGYVTVPFTTEEWYAPGVGLVKMTREEKLEADTMEGGSYTMELVSLDD